MYPPCVVVTIGRPKWIWLRIAQGLSTTIAPRKNAAEGDEAPAAILLAASAGRWPPAIGDRLPAQDHADGKRPEQEYGPTEHARASTIPATICGKNSREPTARGELSATVARSGSRWLAAIAVVVRHRSAQVNTSRPAAVRKGGQGLGHQQRRTAQEDRIAGDQQRGHGGPAASQSPASRPTAAPSRRSPRREGRAGRRWPRGCDRPGRRSPSAVSGYSGGR